MITRLFLQVMLFGINHQVKIPVTLIWNAPFNACIYMMLLSEGWAGKAWKR